MTEVVLTHAVRTPIGRFLGAFAALPAVELGAAAIRSVLERAKLDPARVSEVAMGHAGIVLGLEVSRLARNNADWHRLLELAAMSRTLIMDEDGVYDAASFNDRMLLGLKGTMSEAELHILKSRLQGGILNKARRGELELPLPIGLVYTPDMRVVLDPDRQHQAIGRRSVLAAEQSRKLRDAERRRLRELVHGDSAREVGADMANDGAVSAVVA